MVDTKTKLGPFQFQNVVMNAAGVRSFTTEELDKLVQSQAGGVIAKSTSQTFEQGNQAPRYADTDLGSIHSMGLPREGLSYYLDAALKQQDQVSKPLFLSVNGKNRDDNLAMLQQINASHFKGITELMLASPYSPQISLGYRVNDMDALLKDVFSFFTKPLGVKLPPYFDEDLFDQVAAVLNRYPLLYVNCISGLPNGLVINPHTETVMLRPQHGFGNIGGQYVKPTALANVRAFYKRLDPKIQIIGTGGVQTGEDLFEHILCGASVVQVGTALSKEGPHIFGRLTRELETIMRQKGYEHIDDFKGKLKTLD
ncbi:dihydroorotate dehydrogenase 1a [Lactobacillus selangorensis]|uniref:dihydroorotate oxidase (fumarate) n=1 Tax=Lactobacillus selangorensis TaxID=81857 RepID=A0A0R2FFY3_9LACO|nr:dihydroorotate oxidase [Lactobacillus selangorensis]KRN27545.1 dihydroorotate dehydrogenase 1a [Lactobacillus selangorensis]KRN30183.1 dihydroorotate dehydrogenase 1a [Lactobacillus selangorensis]